MTFLIEDTGLDLIRPDFLGMIGRALRLIFPTETERLLIRSMRRFETFDPQFYRQQEGLFLLHRLFPAQHYAVLGEALGYCPNQDFDPKAYLAENTDVAAAGVSPMLHWLTSGRQEGRRLRPVPALPPETVPYVGFQPRAFPNPHPLAVVVHIFYPEIWPEISGKLARLSVEFDLFISVVDRPGHSDKLVQTMREEWPHAQIHLVGNKGRDLLPFMTFVNSGILESYQAVLKVHGKRSAHRLDGDFWRRHLLAGVMPRDHGACLENFLADEALGVWVADRQRLTHSQWWGQNHSRIRELLSHIEATPGELVFPAGSIFWVKPAVLRALRVLNLSERDFEPEAGQLDGTTAHALERVVGLLARQSGLTIAETSELRRAPPAQARKRPSFVSAFYLPQFHPIPENDEWWGQGFTEWRGVTSARPAYRGHQHPFLPADLGFYDLRQTDVMAKQAELARGAGIDAFCVYFYWFDRQRLLEAPIDALKQRKDVAFPHFFCWANESWRRNWDGCSGDILVEQRYAPGFEGRLARDVVPYFRDARYQSPDGKRKRFVIYRPMDLPTPEASVRRLRQAWRDLGVGEVEIGAVRFLGEDTRQSLEGVFDFLVEMPPHGFITEEDLCTPLLPDLSDRFEGLAYDYDTLVDRSMDPEYLRALPKNTIRGVMPSWDNTARRGLSAHIAYGANPVAFRRWLSHLQADNWQSSYRGELFINAWNEWGEKAVLEPSQRYGRAYLDALKEVTR